LSEIIHPAGTARLVDWLWPGGGHPPAPYPFRKYRKKFRRLRDRVAALIGTKMGISTDHDHGRANATRAAAHTSSRFLKHASLAALFAGVPLMLGPGTGSELRRSLGKGRDRRRHTHRRA
jgi:hypothetical protein